MTAPTRLEALRVTMVTEGCGDAARIEAAVAAAIRGGVRAVQVREAAWSARRLAAMCDRLRARLDAVGGLLLVNDRVDVAAAGYADGVQLGWRSLAAADARRILPAHAVIGVSAHDPDELRAAAAGGADFATLSPVFATGCKPGAPCLGVARAEAWIAAAAVPVLWLGGIDAATVRNLPTGPGRVSGVAVRGALADPDSAESAAAAIVDALGAMVVGS